MFRICQRQEKRPPISSAAFYFAPVYGRFFALWGGFGVWVALLPCQQGLAWFNGVFRGVRVKRFYFSPRRGTMASNYKPTPCGACAVVSSPWVQNAYFVQRSKP